MQNQRTSTMSTPNPLMPQGALQRPSSTARSRTITAISVIVTLHIVLIVGFLMGCNRDKSVDYGTMSSPETLPKHEDPYHSEAFPPLSDAGADTESARTGAAAASGRVRQVTTPIVAGPPPDTSHRGADAATGSRRLELPVSPQHSESVVPAPPAPPPSPGISRTTAPLPPDTISAAKYAIQRGDTFSSIASRNGVTLDALLRANPTADPRRLQIGAAINIPASERPRAEAPAPSATRSSARAAVPRTYEVQPGDSLTAIAGKTGTTIAAIKQANNLRGDRIKIGDTLKIPAK